MPQSAIGPVVNQESDEKENWLCNATFNCNYSPDLWTTSCSLWKDIYSFFPSKIWCTLNQGLVQNFPKRLVQGCENWATILWLAVLLKRSKWCCKRLSLSRSLAHLIGCQSHVLQHCIQKRLLAKPSKSFTVCISFCNSAKKIWSDSNYQNVT